MNRLGDLFTDSRSAHAANDMDASRASIRLSSAAGLRLAGSTPCSTNKRANSLRTASATSIAVAGRDSI